MNASLKLSLFILHTAAVPLSPFVCATERNSLNENEDADQRFSVSRQQDTPKTYLPAASPRALLRPLSVAVWKRVSALSPLDVIRENVVRLSLFQAY